MSWFLPHFWRTVLLGIGLFIDRFFSFHLFNTLPFVYLPPKFLMRNLQIILSRMACMWWFCFSLAAFKILYLSLAFESLIKICLNVGLFEFILFGTLCASCIWISVFFFKFGNFYTIISSNIFLISFSLSSPSGTTKLRMLVHLMLSERSLKLFSFFKFGFLFAVLNNMCLGVFLLGFILYGTLCASWI